MKHVDMRRLPAAAQEERRRQVIGPRQAGQTYDAIAARVGLSPTGVFDICKRYAERGTAGLKTGPRGPEPGYGRFLDAEQEAEARDLIRRHTPDELDLPFALWSRAAVRELIWQRFGVRLAVRTMGTYLARWGFTVQKPLRRAYEQDPTAVRRWIRRDDPAIAARAKAEGGTVFWGDGRRHCLRRPALGRRARPQLRAARPHAGGAGQPQAGRPRPHLGRHEQGRAALDGAGRRGQGTEPAPLPRPPDAGRRPEGLPRPRPSAGPSLRKVRAWLAGREAEIEVFYLPGYSPELNPDEGINGDLKQIVTRKAPARSKQHLKRAVIGHMRRLSKSPDRVRSFFGHRTFRYAA